MLRLSQKKKRIVYLILSCAAVVYLAVSLGMVSGKAADEMCRGVIITVHDTAELKFVKPHELAVDLGELPRRARSMKISGIDLDSIEKRLQRFDKIENVNVTALSNGKIHIEVWPMRPVIRVFDQFGASYYLNRSGKRMVADPRYYVDVPVVTGNFTGIDSITGFIMPLLDYIEADSLWSHAIDAVKVQSPQEVILLPVIHGHVVNFGTPDNFDDKFMRLKAFYTKVMPVKGWDYYDTVSVRWAGQVVSTRRVKKLPEPPAVEYNMPVDIDDPETMSAGPGIAPGQALPDRPAKSDKPVPGAGTLKRPDKSHSI